MLYRQIGRLGSSENLIDIDSALPKLVGGVKSVGDEPPFLSVIGKRINGGQPIAFCARATMRLLFAKVTKFGATIRPPCGSPPNISRACSISALLRTGKPSSLTLSEGAAASADFK